MSELEREKFEAWIIEVAYWEQGTPPRREDGRYVSEKTEERWRGWLARSESAPTRESLHAEWMAQEKYLDWSNFLLHKLTGGAESPAPAGCPQCGSVNRDYCNPECSNIFTRNEWHRLAAPAPTEEK